jgi:hypothetical protein
MLDTAETSAFVRSIGSLLDQSQQPDPKVYKGPQEADEQLAYRKQWLRAY